MAVSLETHDVLSKGKRKKKNLESLVSKAKKRQLSNVSGETNESPSDDGYGTADQDNKSPIGFTVIGSQKPSILTSVRHHLPVWLSNPIAISTDIRTSQYPVDEQNGLDKILCQNLVNNGITNFFPVQQEVLLWMLNDIAKFGLNISDCHRPRDLCVSAPTGSGKTLAYVLPIVQCLSKRVVPKIRALIVAPVQELVIQIASVFTAYCKGTNLRVMSAVGGRTPLSQEKSKLIKNINDGFGDLESSVDILVTTPGRLVEHLENTEGFDLQSLRFLVMDEADRMLDNIQNDWLYHLEKYFSRKGVHNLSYKKSWAQKLLFSATLSQDPEKLKKLNLFQPILFTSLSKVPSTLSSDKTEDYIGSFTTPSELKEKFIIAENVFKPLAVAELLDKGWRHVLCFTKSAADAHKLSKLLTFLHPSLNIQEISSLLTTAQRDTILKDFRTGSIDMLVCSDVMARGMDIDQVKYVISYDPPKHIQTYIHRVGRTGRAGLKGNAITLVTPSQFVAFDKMLNDVNKTDVKQMVLDEEQIKERRQADYKTALQKLKTLLQKEQKYQIAKKDSNVATKKKKRKKMSKKKKRI